MSSSGMQQLAVECGLDPKGYPVHPDGMVTCEERVNTSGWQGHIPWDTPAREVVTPLDPGEDEDPEDDDGATLLERLLDIADSQGMSITEYLGRIGRGPEAETGDEDDDFYISGLPDRADEFRHGDASFRRKTTTNTTKKGRITMDEEREMALYDAIYDMTFSLHGELFLYWDDGELEQLGETLVRAVHSECVGFHKKEPTTAELRRAIQDALARETRCRNVSILVRDGQHKAAVRMAMEAAKAAGLTDATPITS